MSEPQTIFDAERVRADFPILAPGRFTPELVYLDTAATSQKPEAVLAALDAFARDSNANVHRGIYALAERATAAYEGARTRIARFIGAPDARGLVFVRNTTEAINLVAYTWGRANVHAGDLILLTELEHHSNIVPWQMLAAAVGARLEFVPIDGPAGHLNLEAYAALLEKGPRLVAFGHASNALGTVNPVAQMTKMAHAAGALVLVDGAQAVAHLPVDVTALDVDFYAFSGHKMLGPFGAGALWARRELLEAMPPFLGGGEMIRSVRWQDADYNEVPWKFEAGTPDVAAAIGFAAAADYLSALGMTAVAAHEQTLLAQALEALPAAAQGIVLVGPPAAERVGVVTFDLPGAHPHDIATILDSVGVAVRAGHHCTMPLHARLGLAATTRASFGPYTTAADISALATGLREVCRVLQLP